MVVYNKTVLLQCHLGQKSRKLLDFMSNQLSMSRAELVRKSLQHYYMLCLKNQTFDKIRMRKLQEQKVILDEVERSARLQEQEKKQDEIWNKTIEEDLMDGK